MTDESGRRPSPAAFPVAAPRRPGGVGKYESHVGPFLDLVVERLAAGLTRRGVAASLGVSDRSFGKYADEHPELADAVRLGECAALDVVESALFRKATQGGKDGMGDTAAMVFYLKNRGSERWRDAQDHNHNFAGLAEKITEARKRAGSN